MHYLIDGHNLIARMPDISLDDPNDEVKLILRLKSWASASRKRRITVIFDGGMPGGKNLRFSNSAVKVIFASAGSTADALLIRRIRRVKNPPEYTLVSSDHQIIDAAQARRMPHQRSEEFVIELGQDKRVSQPGSSKISSLDESEDPQISEEEVSEWLTLFGPVPKSTPPKRKRRPKPPATEPQKSTEKPTRRKPLTTAKREDRKLSDDEVDEWLSLFGGEET